MKLKYAGMNEFHCHERETGKYFRFMPGDIIDASEELTKLLQSHADFREATVEDIEEFKKNKADEDAKEAVAVKKAQAELHGKQAKAGNEAPAGAAGPGNKEKKGKKK